MKPLVLVGHAHSCPLHGPGKVISGASGFSSNGRAVACVGDTISCGATITTGTAGFSVGGRLVACEGDKTDHGGTLVEGEPSFLLGGQ